MKRPRIPAEISCPLHLFEIAMRFHTRQVAHGLLFGIIITDSYKACAKESLKLSAKNYSCFAEQYRDEITTSQTNLQFLQ